MWLKLDYVTCLTIVYKFSILKITNWIRIKTSIVSIKKITIQYSIFSIYWAITDVMWDLYLVNIKYEKPVKVTDRHHSWHWVTFSVEGVNFSSTIQG